MSKTTQDLEALASSQAALAAIGDQVVTVQRALLAEADAVADRKAQQKRLEALQNRLAELVKAETASASAITDPEAVRRAKRRRPSGTGKGSAAGKASVGATDGAAVTDDGQDGDRDVRSAWVGNGQPVTV